MQLKRSQLLEHPESGPAQDEGVSSINSKLTVSQNEGSRLSWKLNVAVVVGKTWARDGGIC